MMGPHCHSDFVFYINVTTNDTEDDMRSVQVYYKWQEDEVWQGGNYGYWYGNNSGYFEYGVKSSYGCTCKTIYWLVEVDDGQNLVWAETNTTLCKPL